MDGLGTSPVPHSTLSCVDMIASMTKAVLAAEDMSAAYVKLSQDLTRQGVPSLVIVDIRAAVKQGVMTSKLYTQMMQTRHVHHNGDGA